MRVKLGMLEINLGKAKIPNSVLVIFTIISLIVWLWDYTEQNKYIAPTPSPSASPQLEIITPLNGTESDRQIASADAQLVTRVIDGDTIELESGEKVRYIGIDTPEKANSECFDQEATEKNKELVLGKKVKLEKDVNDRDRYGRLLRYVYVDDTFVNLELVKQGYAFASSYPPDIRYQPQLQEAQRTARETKLGLWQECQY